MPQPEGSELNFGFSPILTNIGVNYLPKLEQYVGRNIFPVVPTASPVGTYNVWEMGDFLRRNGKEIANYEAVPLGGFATTQRTFSVRNWGVGTPYTARDLADARRGGMSDQKFKNGKARWVTTQGVLELEFRVRDFVQTAANWTTTIAGVTSGPSASQFIQWDQAASTPVDDVLKWKRNMRLLTGFEPNTMVIPEPIMLVLQRNAQVIARVTPGFYGAGKAVPVQVSIDQIKTLFGIEKILVPKGVYNSAAEGQTPTLVDIWTATTMWLGYVTENASVDEPSAGYQFAWTGDTTTGLPEGVGSGEGPQNFGSQLNDEGLFIREYVDQPRAARVIEGMIWRSPNIVGPSLGMTWTATIAT
jgi:hypothetical protein